MHQKLYQEAIELTQALVRFNTVNPPGNEGECAKFVGGYLADCGYALQAHEFAPNRPILIARKEGNQAKAPLCLTGHLDTVPFGQQEWRHAPLSALIENNSIYGRGSADMKGAVAAMMVVARQMADEFPDDGGLMLIITSGEERACEGVRAFAGQPALFGEAGALLVGEPTSNTPQIAHKGLLWLEAIAKGKTAHGSTPEFGENAILKIVQSIVKLSEFSPSEVHPLLGRATYNVGTISGGQNINSVPDYASFTVDLRTLPEQFHPEIKEKVQQLVGDDIMLNTLVDLPAVSTEEHAPWVQAVNKIVTQQTGHACPPAAANYMTDAGVLKSLLGNPPVIILGPGDIQEMHQVDESLKLDDLKTAVNLYLKIAHDWIRNPE